jgi:hypothetical protein
MDEPYHFPSLISLFHATTIHYGDGMHALIVDFGRVEHSHTSLTSIIQNAVKFSKLIAILFIVS